MVAAAQESSTLTPGGLAEYPEQALYLRGALYLRQRRSLRAVGWPNEQTTESSIISPLYIVKMQGSSGDTAFTFEGGTHSSLGIADSGAKSGLSQWYAK